MVREKVSRMAIFVGFLWVLQSAGRIAFAAIGSPLGMGQFLDVPISSATSIVLFVMFLLLGVFGLIAAFGLLTRRKWGFWSIMLVSVATIAFDTWGLAIQSTAAIGFIIPIISILTLLFKNRSCSPP